MVRYRLNHIIGIVLNTIALIIGIVILLNNGSAVNLTSGISKMVKTHNTYCYSSHVDMFPLILNAWPDVGMPNSWQFFDRLEGKHMYTCKKDIEFYKDPTLTDKHCPYNNKQVKILEEYTCVQCELANICIYYCILVSIKLFTHLYDVIMRPRKLMKTVISYLSVINPLLSMVLHAFMIYQRFRVTTMLCLCTYENAVFDLYEETNVS